ncbi:MAG: 2-dehydro-3-deoxygalactonokinase [Alphaproteobacteria bacterium]|nr:2-dehydro-3-deoxygalactonokinase [Alphaproteobacteria bacterium]MBU1552820.1 2-dehydro-3-deoxygalactonokinase [Alphaproteobacteria bacterium]MBU2334642.1 2-dehydro-3-deoxygalactonokinase [Alphaproteobacteria bacterium]MBU2388390.1 2-dehydro-3-deoxygalactonokinase [Alphaproteobacteria bacterium]
MTKPAYAAVDWGTSSFRLWLMDAEDTVLAERRSSEGMTSAAQTGFPEVLAVHLSALEAPSDLPVIICGMAGARQGWVEAGYVDVPAPLPAVLAGAVRVGGIDRDVRILPGLAQRKSDAPDVMRGEETQLLGALQSAAESPQIVCMPGTHSKWVAVTDDLVTGFATFMTGELFDLLSKHSVLSHSVAGAASFDADCPAFLSAVKAAFRAPQRVSNILFTVRSGTLLQDLSPTDAAARLSGTLIGLEIAGALGSVAERPVIRLVASGKLRSLYESALSVLSLSFQTIDADEAVRRGLSAAAHKILLAKPEEQP